MSNTLRLPALDLFHATQTPFERPDFSLARQASMKFNKQPKGLLGFWMAPNPELCEGIGAFMAKVELHEDARPVGLDLDKLVEFHYESPDDATIVGQLNKYENLRERLREKSDVLFILDNLTRVGEVVLLNPDAIHKLNFIPAEELPTHRNREEQQLPLKWLRDPAFMDGNRIIDLATQETRAKTAQAYLESRHARVLQP